MKLHDTLTFSSATSLHKKDNPLIIISTHTIFIHLETHSTLLSHKALVDYPAVAERRVRPLCRMSQQSESYFTPCTPKNDIEDRWDVLLRFTGAVHVVLKKGPGQEMATSHVARFLH